MEMQYCDVCGDVTSANHAGSANETLCAKCGGGPASAAAPRSGLQLLDDPGFGGAPSGGGDVSAQDLEFFSSDTLAMRRERPKSTKLKLVDARDGGSTAEKKPGSAALGSTQPMSAPVGGAGGAADRWRVDCLLCGGSLSVRPVPKRSKLRCPRCQQIMVLDPSGQVSPVGSVAQPRAPRPAAPAPASPPRPAPSAAVPRGKPAAPAPSAAVPRAKAPQQPRPAAAGAPAPSAAMRRAPAPMGGPAPGAGELDFGDLLGGGSGAVLRPGGGGSVAIAPPPSAQLGGGGLGFPIPEDTGLLPSRAETGEGVATALLGDERYGTGAMAPPTRVRIIGRPYSTVSAFGSLLWITLALLPSLCGILAVHEASGWFGQGLLNELGEAARANSVRLLDWCAATFGL